jgi:hypothetical protein
MTILTSLDSVSNDYPLSLGWITRRPPFYKKFVLFYKVFIYECSFLAHMILFSKNWTFNNILKILAGILGVILARILVRIL